MYPEWHRRLLAGFNLLFYGFGSKMSLLREFALSECTMGPIVEVNGYVATTRLGKVLNEVTEDLIGLISCVCVCVYVCRECAE
jgi:origin recognition complex subunit 2